MADIKSVYQLVIDAAGQALAEMSRDKDEDARFSGAEILNQIRATDPETAGKVQSSWGTYLTKASNDPSTRITRDAGRFGYYLTNIWGLESTADLATEPLPVVPEAGRQEREARLYDLLKDWFESADISAVITASAKRGGAWGNPDVTGVALHDEISAFPSIEIQTIEAKLTANDWKRTFFEAVSHKRFAHRAYFAFGLPAEEVKMGKVPEYAEMREYGEKFRVGILAVFMAPELHEKLLTASDISGVQIGLDDVRVEEVWPALYDTVKASSQSQFLRDVLGIRSLQDLYRIGMND